MHHILLLLSALSYIEGNPGIPMDIDYKIPDGYECYEFALTSDSLYAVLSSENGVFNIVPLVFADPLPLPILPVWNEESDTLYLDPPLIAVKGSFLDSLMTPSFPPFPGAMYIPPGLPEDYARNVSFWLVWGKPPPFPWLIVIGGLALAAALAAYLIKRKKAKSGLIEETDTQEIPSGKAAEKEALDLLESENFIHGRWAELYAEVDSQYRTTVAFKFAIVNKALTLNQISRAVISSRNGRKFLEEASPLTKEITLQRYADWGSSRERATGFIRRLAKLRREWSR